MREGRIARVDSQLHLETGLFCWGPLLNANDERQIPLHIKRQRHPNSRNIARGGLTQNGEIRQSYGREVGVGVTVGRGRGREDGDREGVRVEKGVGVGVRQEGGESGVAIEGERHSYNPQQCPRRI